MTVIILIAEMVILIPSLSRFHHNEMLIEARRQLYLHQVAVLHGEQGFASEISPMPWISPLRSYVPMTKTLLS
jgi:hypothetical protein